MLVLCSNGLSSEKLLASIRDKIGCCQRAALVVTADNEYKENNATEVLKDVALNRILIGWSAAAFVFGPTLELVNCYSSEMNFLGITDLRGLSLTEVQVLPHYDKFLSRFEQFEEKCCNYEKEKGVKVIRINDGEGVFIDKEIIICKE